MWEEEINIYFLSLKGKRTVTGIILSFCIKYMLFNFGKGYVLYQCWLIVEQFGFPFIIHSQFQNELWQ